MLHIILLLLKIIGIILLLILALILLILGIVLLSPITYQAEGSYYGQPDVAARIRWLFVVFRADIGYHDGKLDITAKVLHKTIVDKHSDQAEADEGLQNEPADDDFDDVFEETEETTETQTPALEAPAQGEAESDETANEAPEAESQPESEEETEPETSQTDESSSEEVIEQEQAEEAKPEPLEEPKRPGPVQRIVSKLKAIIRRFTDHKKTEPDESEEKPSLGERAGEAIDRAIDKLDETSDKIDEKLEGIEKKIDGVTQKLDFFEQLMQTEYMQQTLVFTGKLLKSIGLHILPRKLSGKIHYGMGDPAATGKILGYSSIFYPVYAGKLELMPDFTQSVAEGDLLMKGRIRLGIFVLWIVKGLLNKHVRKAVKVGLRIKKTKSFKEDILWQ